MKKSIILVIVMIGLISVGSFYFGFKGKDSTEDLTGESVQDDTMEEDTPEEVEETPEEVEEPEVINLEVGEGDSIEF